MLSNVYLVAACLPLNVVENQNNEGPLCRLLLGTVTGHSLRTVGSSVTKESAIF
jgi:hypothetical protein